MSQKITADVLRQIAAGASLKTDTRVSDVCDIQLFKIITNPHQPRLSIAPDELRELSESIRLHGLIQPIAVVRTDAGYTLISGHRRLEAHKILGRDTVRANIIDADDDDLAVLALIENVQRSDLHPLEIALAISHEPFVSMRDDMISSALGYSMTKLRNIRAILRLSKNAQEYLKLITQSIGVEILVEVQKLPERIHHDVLLEYVKGKQTREDIRALVRTHTAHTTPKPSSPISRKGKTFKIDCDAVSGFDMPKFETELHDLITKYIKG